MIILREKLFACGALASQDVRLQTKGCVTTGSYSSLVGITDIHTARTKQDKGREKKEKKRTACHVCTGIWDFLVWRETCAQEVVSGGPECPAAMGKLGMEWARRTTG